MQRAKSMVFSQTMYNTHLKNKTFFISQMAPQKSPLESIIQGESRKVVSKMKRRRILNSWDERDRSNSSLGNER
jgi:hypothetical protein